MKTINQSDVSVYHLQVQEQIARLSKNALKATLRITLLLLFSACSLFLSAPTFAQSVSDAMPKKWPDQAECRALSQSGQGTSDANSIINGWCIAIDDRRGNCIACHTFNISPWPVSLPIAGNLAPPMVAMRARFPDSATLRAVIEDASALNVRSSMPPYLKHQILSAEEIDQVIAFLGTL